MDKEKQIGCALISVYHKDNLDEIVTRLHQLGVSLISTGGTADFIESLNLPVQRVEFLTGYPSILGGRVKTLHPKVFGGILARRECESDIESLKSWDIPEIDLVIVDLYPFEATVASGAQLPETVEPGAPWLPPGGVTPPVPEKYGTFAWRWLYSSRQVRY